MPEPLTERQRQVYEALRDFIQENQIPPTVRQVGEMVGLRSTASVQRVLDVLAAKGWITRQKGAYRTVNLVPCEEESGAEMTLPLVGNIAAGLPREAVQDMDTVTVSWPGTRCLEVTGNAFAELDILPGDRMHLEPFQPGQTPLKGQFLCRAKDDYTLVHARKLEDQPWDCVLGRVVAVTRALN